MAAVHPDPNPASCIVAHSRQVPGPRLLGPLRAAVAAGSRGGCHQRCLDFSANVCGEAGMASRVRNDDVRCGAFTFSEDT